MDTDSTCRFNRAVYKDSSSSSTMNLKGESENSNNAIQLSSSACRIPASMHVNPRVPPALSCSVKTLLEGEGKREEDRRYGRLATSQDGCRWHQRCGARPVKISSQARISATPAARKGRERDEPREERIVERGVYVRRCRGSLSKGRGENPGSKGRRSFLSSWPRALIGDRGRLQPTCYHDYRRDNPAAAD